MGAFNKRKEIESMGFIYDDVVPFMQMLSLSEHWFIKSASVRKQYCSWRDGKVVIFGKYVKSSDSEGGEIAAFM